MKIRNFLLIIIVLVFFTACTKDDDRYYGVDYSIVFPESWTELGDFSFYFLGTPDVTYESASTKESISVSITPLSKVNFDDTVENRINNLENIEGVDIDDRGKSTVAGTGSTWVVLNRSNEATLLYFIENKNKRIIYTIICNSSSENFNIFSAVCEDVVENSFKM